MLCARPDPAGAAGGAMPSPPPAPRGAADPEPRTPPLPRRPVDLTLLPLRFEPAGADLAEGLRAACSVAALIALGIALHQPLLAVAALGALLTCFTDPGGPIRARLAPLLSFAVVGALAWGVCGLARAQGLWLALPLGAVLILAGSFARAFGPAWMVVGNLFVVMVAIGLDQKLPPALAADFAALFLAGGIWAVLLTLALWRLHPFAPARGAVAASYRALGRMAADLRAVLRDPAADETTWASPWATHARAGRRAVREALEAARASLLGTLRARGPARARASELLIRLEAAEQVFGALIALAETLQDDPAPRPAAAAALRRLRPILDLLAQAIVHDRPATLARLPASIAAMERAAPLAAFGIIADRLRAAVTAAAIPGVPDPPPEAGWRQALATLRANLTPRSVPLRHAARATIAAIPALWFTMTHPTPYGHWLTITLLLTMQPYFGLTWVRALERIGGTVAGGLVAAVLSLMLRQPASIAVALFPLCLLSMSLRKVSYALFLTTLTPVVVLLVELTLPGTSELTIALMRAAYTVAGGGLAVLACLVLWPGFGASDLGDARAAARAAHADYADAVLGALAAPAPRGAADAARRAAGLASNNLEAALSRLMLEPRRADYGPALTEDAALRRLAGRLLAVQLDPDPGRPDAAAWRGWIRAGLTGARAPPGPPPVAGATQAAGEALARMARQVGLIAGVRMAELDAASGYSSPPSRSPAS